MPPQSVQNCSIPWLLACDPNAVARLIRIECTMRALGSGKAFAWRIPEILMCDMTCLDLDPGHLGQLRKP